MRWRRDDVLDVRPGEPVGHEQVLRRDRKRSTRRFIVVLNVRFVERKSAIRLLFDKQRSADKLTAAEKPCRTDAVRIALGTHRNRNRVARLHRRDVRGVDRDRRSRDRASVQRRLAAIDHLLVCGIFTNRDANSLVGRRVQRLT